ncbi:MAG: histidine--tRNA ligase [Rubrivirga sp.]
MAFQTIRGTFDILPDEHGSSGSTVPASSSWRWVEGVVRGVMERFAFEEIRTPVLEPVELVARGVGAGTDIVSKEMFTVERSKETYVLRPEVTAPVMRAFLQHHLEQRGGAQRLYYIGPCFRAERPQKGRFRQFHQFGTELIGSDDPRADAETIANVRAIYTAFGVTRTTLRINTLGDAADRPAYRDALRDYFSSHLDALSETSRTRLEVNPLRILDTKNERERELLGDAPRVTDFISPEAREHHARLLSLLDALEVPYVEDPLLVRGLDYYSRTVFELEHDALGAQGALAAGGRYDGLAESVGSKKTVPAVGYAAGIERLFIALEAENVDPPLVSSTDVFVVTLGDAAESAGFGITQTLRTAGLSVDFALGGRSLKAQMKAADRSGARVALVVGDDELEAGVAQVRDLEFGEQRAVPIAQLALELAGEGAA